MREVDDAANGVLRAMRALDAHRHDGAPTLQREYQRALETYFVAAERAAGRDPLREEIELDGEETDAAEETRAEDLRHELTAIAGHYAAARRALRLARAYRMEPQSSGRRERECLAVARRHREAVRALRLQLRPAAEQLPLPGLAKTRPADETRRTARTG